MRLQSLSFRFVAENNEALRRSSRRRSPSPNRSRSRSPYKRRYSSSSRSRSPHYKTQISHIARKRTRSKSPDAGYTKFNRSPRRRSTPERRISPKYAENKRNRANKYNGNGRLQNTKPRSPPKIVKDKEKGDNEEEPKEENVQEQPKESKNSEVKTNREKTEQELEDELLASTDSESLKDFDNDFKITLDEKELDFLDDDDEESENEGRFKSNTSSKPAKGTTTTSSFKPLFASKGFDKSRGGYTSNHRRNRYNDEPKRHADKKRSRSPIDSSQRSKDEKRYSPPLRKQKRSPEVQKSPENTRKLSTKEPVQSTKVIIINKDKDTNREKDKPLFKATFKSVEPPSVDKNKGKLR